MSDAPPSGFLNLIKPPGMTSHDVVDLVRKRLPRKTKVGHLGTLDPDACGVLPLAVGTATKLIPLLPDLGSRMKGYHARIQLGLTTSTDDLAGEILSRNDDLTPSRQELETALGRFRGELSQVPPQVSAIRKDGERAYEVARRGETVVLDARQVTIEQCQLLDYDAGRRQLTLFMLCSSGTYVRSLARDLGEILGSGAALAFLIRTQSGPFLLDQARTLEELYQGPVSEQLLAEEYPFRDLPVVKVEVRQKGEIVNGVFPEVERCRAPAGLLVPLDGGKQARVEAVFGRAVE